MEFKLVYGNYGRSSTPFNPPVYLNDILLLVKYGLEAAGHRVDLEYRLCPGKTNILLENFTYDFIEEYKVCQRVPGTEFILIATDFITGNTFNDFGASSVPGGAAQIYEDQVYWLKRYTTFCLAAERARAVWHLNADQVEVYRRQLNRKSIHFFPHGHLERFSRVGHNRDADKDIDVFFSGTVTPYRERVLADLSARGLHVQICPSTTSPLIRDDLVGRSKLAVNVRQHAAWEYPSTSRIHYHLSNRSPLISERCNHGCSLSPFVVQANADAFIEEVAEAITSKDYARLADSQHERFVREMPLRPRIETLLDSTYSR